MTVGDWLSFGAGGVLLWMSYLVMMAYRPKKWPAPDGPGYLAAAIFIAFFAAGANTLYWQVFGQIAVPMGWATVEQMRSWGDYLDVAVKGGAAVAGYLHLKALHASLPQEERRGWGVLEMAFYPHRRLCLRLMSRALGKAKEDRE